LPSWFLQGLPTHCGSGFATPPFSGSLTPAGHTPRLNSVRAPDRLSAVEIDQPGIRILSEVVVDPVLALRVLAAARAGLAARVVQVDQVIPVVVDAILQSGPWERSAWDVQPESAGWSIRPSPS
jgi:hypothetical protein